MCRADINPQARPLLAQILHDMATAIAAPHGLTADDVTIGPVDFGTHTQEENQP